MMQSIRHIFIGLSAALLVFPAGTALADQRVETDANKAAIVAPVYDVRQFAQSFDANTQRRISASQAKSIAMSRVPGAKFVNIQMTGGNTYRVRVQQKNGKIVDVYVDARTGRVKN
jgi:uncharacterized membrane protein YkoI